MVRIPAGVRRERLVDAAIRVMARDGLAAATTRAVVAEAGMALATFHYCFRSRNEMLAEVITTLGRQEREAAIAAMEPGGTVSDALRQALDGYLEWLAANPGYELVLFELNHQALRTPELRELAADQYRGYFSSAAAVLDAAASAARARWTLDMDVLARLLVVVTDGITTTWLADRDAAATRAVADPLIASIAALAEVADNGKVGRRRRPVG